MDTDIGKPNCSSSSIQNEEYKRLQSFFQNQLYNSSQATDDFIKTLELKTNDDTLTRKALALYQAHYNKLKNPWEHVTFMYGLGIIYMHFNAYDWAIKAFRDILYVNPNFDRSKDIHLRLGLIFKALGRHKLSDKHFRIAQHDLRPKNKPPPGVNELNNVATNKVQEPRTRLHVNLCSDDNIPPYHHVTVPPYPPLNPSKFDPSPPWYHFESKKDLISRKKEVQECCLNNAVTIMRNLASVLKLDLGLFSTKTLLDNHPDHPIIVQSHNLPIKKHVDNTNDLKIPSSTTSWKHFQHLTKSTLANYCMYQAATFKESFLKEKHSKVNGTKAVKESGTESNESNADSKQSNSTTTNHNAIEIGQNSTNNQCNTNHKLNNIKKLKKATSIETKYIKSAHKIDLSDETEWKLQLHELNKMPSFIRCISASNILTHLAKTVPGLNSIEMSMHVPDCRIFGKKTDNDFCSAHLNVGPGDYEWYSISSEYSYIMTKLCNNNGIEMDDSNWWPSMEDLEKYNIPVYKFSQRPGDLIWINSGTIYWITSNGWCNNIHWNVGPLCAKQYRAAAVSYEIDKLMFRKSQAPMIQLSWNIVINIDVILDKALHQHLVGVLQRSIHYCKRLHKLILRHKQDEPVVERITEPTYGRFCNICDCEVFNIYLVEKDNNWINCIECALRYDSTFEKFVIKQDYDIDYLMKLYNDFTQQSSASRKINY